MNYIYDTEKKIGRRFRKVATENNEMGIGTIDKIFHSKFAIIWRKEEILENGGRDT